MTTIGEFTARYGVVSILLAFGIFKFTYTEAQAIKPLIDDSPLFSWMNHFFSMRVISSIIGVIEIVAALGIAGRFLSPDLAFYGSLLGCMVFFSTLSFLFTSSGMWVKTEWLWLPNDFIIKDLVLLGFCLWSTGEAYSSK